MLSLVRYTIYGLAGYANLCGVLANDEHVSSTSASAVATSGSQAAISASNSSPSVPTTRDPAATCTSKTINYITHTLAQQCLRTDRSRSLGPSGTSSGNESSLSTAEVSVTKSISSISTTASTTSVIASILPQTASSPSPVTSQDSNTEIEADSALDNANFLSFEDWKQQNLAKAGQSGDNIGVRQPIDPGRRPPNVNALDSLGEESEIELDFSGFGGAPARPDTPRQRTASSKAASTDEVDVGQVSPASQALKPKDAGKTCKERTNYASFDCAATVLKSNQECKSASSVLVENKDSYMLNKCSASNKYFIVELCNDILVDTVVLANYEFFSSIFRTFRVSVSDRYPAKAEKWKDLGTFEARNTREVQAFLIENPLIWARYLRIEFLTHYGSEYYCPVSLLRVHGTTMMEEFRNQEELARGEAQDDGVALEDVETASIATTESTATAVLITAEQKPDHTSDAVVQVNLAVNATISSATTAPALHDSSANISTSSTSRVVITTSPTFNIITHSHSTCPSDMSTTTAQARIESLNITSLSQTGTGSSSSPAATTQQGKSTSATMTSLTSSTYARTSTTSISSGQSSSSPTLQDKASLSVASHETTGSAAGSSSSVPSQSHNSTAKDTVSKVSSSESTKPTTPAAPQTQPPTQESFFKSISKRLQQLESNSTLSLQYIEQQSRILRDAFAKVEKRQMTTTTTFLANLNNTVMAELAGFRQAYDQLWQSTVIELEGQREQHQREMTALSSRLTLVVDELVWQKRMGIVQSTLLLLCLGLVLFARPGHGTVDASLAQQVVARSQAAFRSGAGSDANSPQSGRSPVSLFRRKLPLWRRSADAVLEKTDDLSISPNSPVGFDSLVDEHDLTGLSSEYDEYDDIDDGMSQHGLDATERDEGDVPEPSD